MAERQDVSPVHEQPIRPGHTSHRRTRYHRRHTVALGAAAVIATATLGGIALGPSSFTTSTIAGRASAATVGPSATTAAPPVHESGGSASANAPQTAGSARTGTSIPSEATGTTRHATSAEEVGVVDITTVLDFGQGAAAGTGVVLTSTGEILTNNHVIEGATRIRVTVPSTRTSYTASVVGTDPTDDIAVLRLSGASGLATARLATDTQAGQVRVGDAVTAVGNAGGTGGTPTAASGTVVALGRDITASDETGADPERLTGLIEVNAAVQAGDSGGPLYSDGVVVGIDTAASASASGGFDTTAATSRSAGFAIPITTATAIAERIVAGEDNRTIHQGEPAFLGVQTLATRNHAGGGATISGVVEGSPAATAGLRAGDTITAINATAVDNTPALSGALAVHRPHDRVRVGWTDTAGTSHTATVTLIAGPAD
jgi:S1-C subfamily serine protease